MRKIIFAKTMRRGIDKLHKLATEKNKQGIGIDSLRQTGDEVSCQFSDGEYWVVLLASDRARGNRCDKAFFEESIPDDIKGNLINSCCSYCKKEDILTF